MSKNQKNKLIPHKQEEAVQRVIELLVNGSSYSDIVAELQTQYKLSLPEAQILVTRGTGALREIVLTDVDKIVARHTELYERIYKEFDELYYVPGKLKALKQKENLLGLVRENAVVEIYNDITIETSEPEYDLSKLNKEEQDKLTKYLKKVGGK